MRGLAPSAFIGVICGASSDARMEKMPPVLSGWLTNSVAKP